MHPCGRGRQFACAGQLATALLAASLFACGGDLDGPAGDDDGAAEADAETGADDAPLDATEESESAADADGAADGDAPTDTAADGDAATCPPEPEHTGEATYYTFADGSGNCGFDPSPDDLMIGAMNHTDYAASAVCGACAHLVGPSGEVSFRIVDQCPECAPGDIDLSPEAFDRIAARELGRVAISWRYIPCAVSGPIVYHFNTDANPWWVGLQLRNHRHPIASLEVRDAGGAWVATTRQDWNYFTFDGGSIPSPYAFRVTDVYGHVLEDPSVALAPGADVAGAGQFPECP